MTDHAVSRARAGYVLAVLSLITLLNFYDRYLIGILVEDLKRDLELSDSQIGVLSGLAFAVVYSVAALPVARYADQGRRVRVLAGAVAFWSMMTGLCGLATGFWTMLLTRFGVGIGEAGGAPTTHAIVAESFSAKWRATALSVIGLSGGLGLVAALAGGGYIAQHYGWRMAFGAGAVPGLLLALVLILTVREPSSPLPAQAAPKVRMGEALRVLARRRAFVLLCLGLALAGIGAFGATTWTPAFLMRHYQLDAGTVGAGYSAAAGSATLIGILLGGVVGDWLSRRDQRWPLWLLAISFGLSAPLNAIFLLLDNYGAALALTFPMTIISSLYISPAYAIVQNLSGPRLRATGAAAFMLVVNLIGQGFGPLAVGWVSDLLEPAFGDDSLRYALLMGSATYALGAILFLMAGRTARADIAEANRE